MSRGLYKSIGTGKATPAQNWTSPEGSGRLRLPDFKAIGTCGKVVRPMHRPPLPQKIFLVLISHSTAGP